MTASPANRVVVSRRPSFPRRPIRPSLPPPVPLPLLLLRKRSECLSPRRALVWGPVPSGGLLWVRPLGLERTRATNLSPARLDTLAHVPCASEGPSRARAFGSTHRNATIELTVHRLPLRVWFFRPTQDAGALPSSNARQSCRKRQSRLDDRGQADRRHRQEFSKVRQQRWKPPRQIGIPIPPPLSLPLHPTPCSQRRDRHESNRIETIAMRLVSRALNSHRHPLFARVRRDVFLSLSAGIAGWGLASGLSDGSNAALAASPKDLKAKSEARKAEMKARAEAMRAEEMKNAAPPPPPPPPPSEEAPPPPPQDGGA